MELTAEQDAVFRKLCSDINPGEYGKVVVNFTGEPSNVVQITGEKNYRFENRKYRGEAAQPTTCEARDRQNSGRLNNSQI